MNKKVSSLIKADIRAWKTAFGIKDPQKYGLNGKPLACPICGHDRFDILPEVWVANFGLICAECGHVDLFFSMPGLIQAGNQ